MTAATAQAQLRSFIAKFAPKQQKLLRSIRRALRRRFPTAHELVYDNYNFFVIGYCSTERPSDSIVSIAAAANGIALCFTHGARLPDPKKILVGSGRHTRFLRVDSGTVLVRPEIEALFGRAVMQTKNPLPAAGRGKLIIRSVSAKQRPRRKAA